MCCRPTPAACAPSTASFALVAQRRHHRAHGAVAGSAHALLPRQARGGPALFVADRIDTLHRALAAEGLAGQFHPSYTRMVPAHHMVEVRLVGCPDPDPTYTRFFTPARDALPADLDEIGRRYIGAARRRGRRVAAHLEREIAPAAPIGVCFSGGVDSGAVFLVTYHVMRRLGLSPARLKAFTLNLGEGPTCEQARAFLTRSAWRSSSRRLRADPSELDLDETLRVLEDYKPLDVECAAVGLLLPRHPRALSRLALPGRRRRRRREPEGLPDRGEPRADDSQRRQQPDALPGGLGRRQDQALADLQRRPEPRLRAHLRAGAPLRVRGLQPVHAAGGDRGRRRDSVRGADAATTCRRCTA